MSGYHGNSSDAEVSRRLVPALSSPWKHHFAVTDILAVCLMCFFLDCYIIQEHVMCVGSHFMSTLLPMGHWFLIGLNWYGKQMFTGAQKKKTNYKNKYTNILRWFFFLPELMVSISRTTCFYLQKQKIMFLLLLLCYSFSYIGFNLISLVNMLFSFFLSKFFYFLPIVVNTDCVNNLNTCTCCLV